MPVYIQKINIELLERIRVKGLNRNRLKQKIRKKPIEIAPAAEETVDSGKINVIPSTRIKLYRIRESVDSTQETRLLGNLK